MRVVAVLGGQWGDEGKGKVVDLLSDRFDIVARYHGGHNAGHTVKFGDRHFALHLLPSGIVRGRKGVIGPGVVVDPEALLSEIDALSAAGIAIGDNLLLSDRAHVILPYHRLLDGARERAAGDAKLGTTLRGIGPAYESAAARHGVRVADLFRPEILARRVSSLAAETGALLSALGEPDVPLPESVIESLAKAAAGSRAARDRHGTVPAGPSCLRRDVARRGRSRRHAGSLGGDISLRHILDLHFGRARRGPADLAAGAGRLARRLEGVHDPRGRGTLSDRASRMRPESTSARAATSTARRPGGHAAPDGSTPSSRGLPSLSRAPMPSPSRSSTCSTTSRRSPSASRYRLDGRPIDSLPPLVEDVARLEPVYETLPGWKSKTTAVTRYEDLPPAAVRYVRFLEEAAGAPAAFIATGPRREETIRHPDSVFLAALPPPSP